MYQKTLIIFMSLALLMACSSKKEAAEASKQAEMAMLTPPKGISFQAFVDYKDVKSIQLPMEGKGFKATIKNADQVLPSIEYKNYHFMFWTGLEGFEGDMDAQFKKLKRRLSMAVDERSQVVFEKRMVGDREVTFVDVYKEIGHGYRTLAYGYLINNGPKRTLLFVKDGYFTPKSDIDAYRATLDEAMQYMIKTLEFKS